MIKRLMHLTGAFLVAGLCMTAGAQDRPGILWKRSVNSDRVNAIIFNSAGDTVISGSSDRLINFWRASDGTLLRTLNQSAEFVHESAIESLAITPDGSRLASASYQVVKLWTLPAGTAKNLTGHSDWVVGVAFSPNGQLLASASFDHTVKIWRASDGALVKTLACPRMMRCVSFSPDGTLLAGGGGSGDLFLWRTSDWTKIKTLPGHTSDIYSITFSPDGTKLATGAYDSTARVWNIPAGSLRFTLPGNGNVYGVAFTPNSQQLAFTDGEGNTIRMHRMSDGVRTRLYTAETPEVQCIAISSAGRMAYGRVDKTLILASYDSTSQPPPPGPTPEPEPEPEPQPQTTWVLNLSTQGNGTVTASPEPNGPDGRYMHGTVVRLAAKADDGNIFTGWTGSSTGVNPSLTVTMNGNRTLSARFAESRAIDAVLMNSKRQLVAWFINGTTFEGQQLLRNGAVLDAHTHFVGLGDVNGDGSPDIILQDKFNRLHAWLMNGTEFLRSTWIRGGFRMPGGWKAIGVADIDGNGQSDIILQHSSGRTSAWLLEGTEFVRSRPLRNGANIAKKWVLAATGDINSDGQTDLIWQNSVTAGAAIWLMEGTDVASVITINNWDLQRFSWRIVSTHDFNGDGNPDVVLQNTADGRIMAWLMDGEDYVGSRTIQNTSGKKMKLLEMR